MNIPESVSFPGAKQFIQIHQTKINRKTGEVTEQDHYFVTSIPFEEMSAKRLVKLVRLHWGIENNANWTCDVIFEEDSHFPCRKGYGPSLMSWLLILAYNIISILRSLGHKSSNKKLPSFSTVIQEFWAMLFGASYRMLFFEDI